MVKRRIVTFDHPLLRRKSQLVKVVDKEVKEIVRDMVDTMYASDGVGLAAVQMGIPKRIICFDISKKRDGTELQVCINPRIVKREGEYFFTEACLSFPGLEGRVKRSRKVWVKALDMSLKEFEIEAEEYLAVVLQHEIDHTEGLCYVDKAEAGTVQSVKDKEDEVDL